MYGIAGVIQCSVNKFRWFCGNALDLTYKRMNERKMLLVLSISMWTTPNKNWIFQIFYSHHYFFFIVVKYAHTTVDLVGCKIQNSIIISFINFDDWWIYIQCVLVDYLNALDDANIERKLKSILKICQQIFAQLWIFHSCDSAIAIVGVWWALDSVKDATRQ